jgi:hypothetical protein
MPRQPAALAPLDARGDIAVFRLPSGFNLRESSEKVRDAIALAVAGRRPWLLVDVRAYAGESPSAGARHELMREWAGASEGRVRIAVLMQARHIDPERLAWWPRRISGCRPTSSRTNRRPVVARRRGRARDPLTRGLHPGADS